MDGNTMAGIGGLVQEIVELRETLGSQGHTLAQACPEGDRTRLIAEVTWCIDSLQQFRAQLQASTGAGAPLSTTAE